MDDFLGVYDNIVSDDYCKSLISLFNRAEDMDFTRSRWEDMGFQEGSKEDESCFAVSIPISHLLSGDQFKPFQDAFWNAYQKYAKKYHVAMSAASEHRMYAIKLQKTKPCQGYHVWHFEASTRETAQRFLTFTLYLNDIGDGGETEFLYQSKRVSPKAGRLVIFPGSFTHTHRGNPPLKDTKYIITGWLDF